jgi:hypothetical protein
MAILTAVVGVAVIAGLVPARAAGFLRRASLVLLGTSR